MENQRRNRVVIDTTSKSYRRGKTYTGHGGPTRPREGLVAISVIAAAAFATFFALFLTSRPYDPMNSSFDAQQAVPQVPFATPSPNTSPSPTPSPAQNATPLESPEPGGEVVNAIPDDAGIQAQIEKAFNSDPALAQLDVSTIVEGGRVTIVGSVRSVELKQRVERTIRSVKGVQALDNQLVVIEPTP
jgi:hypothetical protein